jgi:WD40 repeat protein
VTWQCVHILKGHTDYIDNLVIDEREEREKARLYSASHDKTIKVWDLETLLCVHTLHGDNNTPISCLSLSHTFNRLYSGSNDGTINIWNTTHSLHNHDDCVSSTTMKGGYGSGGVYCLCLSPDESRLYSGSLDCLIRVWNTATHRCIAILHGHTRAVTSLCLSSKTNRLISASTLDRTIRV